MINKRDFPLLVIIGMMTAATVLTMMTDNIEQLALHNIHHEDFRMFQILTSLFVHGSFLHLFMNSTALWVISRMIDKDKDEANSYTVFDNYKKVSGIYGRSLLVLILGSLTSSVAISLFSKPEVLTVGLSGGILALFGFVFAHWRYSAAQKLMLIDLVIIIALGFVVPQISQIGHLSGLIFGIIMAVVFNIIDYRYMKKNNAPVLDNELFKYIQKLANYHVLTGIAKYRKHSTKLSRLIIIMQNPKAGFGMNHYKKRI